MTRIADSDWKILPFIAVGPIEFGQPRSQVLALLGMPSRTFRKVPFAATDTDAYDAVGLHIYYDPKYRVESVDAVHPSTISLGELSFLGRKVEDVVKEMGALGYDDISLTYNDVGVSLFELHGIVRCITVFPRGYFDLNDPKSPASRARAAAAAWAQKRW